MVKLMDSEVMAKDQVVKDLRMKLYFNPSMSEDIFKEMESMFKGHIMINVRKNKNDKFIIEKVSNLSR
jgi:hypothetical protein